MRKPHKHCELIKAWADGAEIEYLDELNDEWKPAPEKKPEWYDMTKYRIKPQPKLDVAIEALDAIWNYSGESRTLDITKAALDKIRSME